MIETVNGIKFGGYINSEINRYRVSYDDSTIISDSNAFVFTFRNEHINKYSIRTNMSQHAFFLYPQNSDRLMWIGLCDIGVFKKGKSCQCLQESLCSFHYGKSRMALIGTTGQNAFNPKRIIVIQMK